MISKPSPRRRQARPDDSANSSSTTGARLLARAAGWAVETLEARRLLSSALTMGPEPTLEPAAAPAAIGSLSGRIVYMNGGHGWTYNGTAWLTQRPEYQEIVEDFGNQDQISFYAQYLLNAGATVVPTRPLGHQVNAVIVDNADPGFSTPIGDWSTNSAGSTYWSNQNGNDSSNRYRFASTSSTESHVARFTPNITQAGFYPVYTWVMNSSNRITDQVYRINSAGGSQEVKVNHKYTGKGWIYLGDFYFEAGTAGNVEVSNRSGNSGVVIADAIRFGNGMGTSGRPREDELSLYWLYESRGWTGAGQRVPESKINRGSSSDSSGGINGPPSWVAYMNDHTQGTNNDRLHLSFHSNGSTGAPDASARGTIALVHSLNPTMNQQWWANAIAEEVEEDMQALPAGTIEHPWWTRANTSSGQYGEINRSNFFEYGVETADEMASTLLEVAFHDNLQDSQLMRDPKVRDWVGRAAYHATVKYFANFAGGSSVLMPGPPTAVRATTNASGQVILNWTAPGTGGANGGAGAATGYKIYYGTSGYTWSDAIVLGNVTSHTISGLPLNQMTYFKVVAVNAGGESLQRDVVAAKPQSGRRAPILIVNGFDRFDRTQNDTIPWSGNNGVTERVRLRYQNTRDYVVQVAEAIEAYSPGLGVETAQNEHIGGAINLSNYHTVIWIGGEESTAQETFSTTEQSLVTSYLNGGGKLFVSGAEIGWDLDANGSDSDRDFYNNLLRADFQNNDAGTYTANGLAGSIFAGITSIVFDNGAGQGAYGTYDVDTPDVIAPFGGSTAAMNYSTGTTAAVQFGSGQTRLVTMGFPFETITDANKRTQVMGKVLDFFDTDSTLVTWAYLDGAVLRMEHIAAGNTISAVVNGANLDLTQNGTMISFPLASFTSIQADGTPGNDVLNVTGTIGKPLTFNGGVGIDQLNVKSGTFTFAADAQTTTQNLQVTVDAGAATVFNTAQHLDALTVNGLATLSEGGNKVLVTRTLSIGSGKLDLKNNDLVVDYSSVSPVGTWTGGAYSGISGLVQTGRNGGAWNGAAGIITTLAEASNRKTIGVAEASVALGLAGSATGTFSGQAVDATSVLVKFTWGGDANLDGRVNIDDYGRIDANVSSSGSVFGWFNGDFNYDGAINIDDYGIIDGNIASQDEIL